ncbi:MAG TPA: antibiotic biosynthesis monooxygenase [Caulobacteraceae bacterium]|jgi:quinol monooxygenase YgiN
MTKVALLVELQAKPDKSAEVARFLASARALAIQEPATLTWYAVQLDADRFAIFDTFEGEPGRQAHLNGPIAAALMSKADELLAVPPRIQQATVLADKAD